MHKETITYTDYNGNTRTETFLFNLSKAEAVEMECSVSGGLTEYMTKLVELQDLPSIIDIMKKLIFKSYGEKSTDGKYFRKSEELSRSFSETEAYSVLFMKLATDADAASKFFNGIVPGDVKAASTNTYIPVTGNVGDVKPASTNTYVPVTGNA